MVFLFTNFDFPVIFSEELSRKNEMDLSRD